MEAENVIFGAMYVIIGLILMIVSVPLKNGRVGMNHFYGVRLRKSFISEKNWYLMNTYGGNQLLRWSSVVVVLGIVTFFFPFNEMDMIAILFLFLPFIVLMIPTYMIVRYSRTLSDN